MVISIDLHWQHERRSDRCFREHSVVAVVRLIGVEFLRTVTYPAADQSRGVKRG